MRPYSGLERVGFVSLGGARCFVEGPFRQDYIVSSRIRYSSQLDGKL